MPRRPWSWRDSLAVRWSMAEVGGLVIAVFVVAWFAYDNSGKMGRSGDLCAALYAKAHTRADTLAVDDYGSVNSRGTADNSCGTLRRLGMVPLSPHRR